MQMPKARDWRRGQHRDAAEPKFSRLSDPRSAVTPPSGVDAKSTRKYLCDLCKEHGVVDRFANKGPEALVFKSVDIVAADIKDTQVRLPHASHTAKHQTTTAFAR
jgi:hypothetical protein